MLLILCTTELYLSPSGFLSSRASMNMWPFQQNSSHFFTQQLALMGENGICKSS
jgi:hypothetical protein